MSTKDFETLVAGSMDRLMSYALTLYSNKMDAEDLTQETVLRMLTKKDQFDGENFKGWSCVVMKSIFLCQMKAAKIRRTDDIDDCYDVSSNISTDTECLTSSLLQYLPEPHRKVMEMIAQGYRYHEIAEIIGIPIGTVKSRIFYSRKLIESIYGKVNF